MFKNFIILMVMGLCSHEIMAQIRPEATLNLKTIKEFVVSTESRINVLLQSKDTLKDVTIFKSPEVKIPDFTIPPQVYERMKPTISNKLFFAQANKVFLGLCLFNLDTASVKVLAIKNSPKSFRISLNVEFTGLFDLDSKKQKISESQEWFCTYNSKKSSFQIESIKSLNPIYTSKILQISDVEKLQNDLQSCLIQMLWKDSSPIQKVQALKKWKNLGGPDSLLVFKSNQAMEKVHLTTWSNNTFLTNVVNSVFINGIDIEQIDVPSINKDGSFISKVTIWKGLFFNKDSPKWYENKQEIYRTVTQKQQSILEIKAVSIKF